MRKILIVCIFILNIFLAGCSKQNFTPVKVDESNNPIESDNSSFNTKDNIKVGDIVVTINSVEETSGENLLYADEGKKFINVNLTIKNIGKAKQYINNKNQFYIVDNNGAQYQLAVTNRTKDNSGSGYIQQTLLPETKKEMWLGYEIPENVESYSLYYSPLFSQEIVKINISNSD